MTSVAALGISRDFICPITQDLMVRPVKTNCKHVFDELAFEKYFKINKDCLICRIKITKTIFDKELANRIEKEFIKISDANKFYFDQLKQFQEQEYIDVIDIDELLSGEEATSSGDWDGRPARTLPTYEEWRQRSIENFILGNPTYPYPGDLP